MDDFQARSGRDGASFHAACIAILRIAGFTIMAQRLKLSCGEEVDIVAYNPQSRVLSWFECKGSYEGSRPGSRRSDTAKKAIATAWHISVAEPERPPYYLLTSHLPRAGTTTAELLDRAVGAGLFTGVYALEDWISLWPAMPRR